MTKSIATVIAETESLIKTVPTELSNSEIIIKALQDEIDRLEDLYAEYSDDCKEDNGFRPRNKEIITEEQIKASYKTRKLLKEGLK